MIHAKAKTRLGNFVLDAEVRDEGFISLTGHNGAGKSTFLNVIAGILRGDESYVEISSIDVTNKSVEKRSTVLVTPQSFIPHLDVEKHLIWGATIHNHDLNYEEVIDVKKALGIDYSGKLQKLSMGMQERVALATAILSRPKLILIDETFSNIDRKTDFITEFRQLCAERKIDVIFTTQFKEDAQFSDHSYEMTAGKSTRIQ
jgi:molybdate/tungstate transport system ATP-binding protein